MLNKAILLVRFYRNPDISIHYINAGAWTKAPWQEKASNSTLEHYTSHVNEMEEICSYTQDYADRILKHWVDNDSKSSTDFKSYNILFRFWLVAFISVVYDRYKNVLNATSKCRDTPFLLAGSNSVFEKRPKSTSAYMQLIKTDQYNNVIYEDIIRYFKLEYVIVENVLKPAALVSRNTNRSIVVRLIIAISKLLLKITPQKVVLYRPYVGKRDSILCQLLLLQFPMFYDSVEIQGRDNGKKFQLKNDLETIAKSEFEKLFANLLPQYVPQSLLTRSEEFINDFKSICLPSKPKLILTANSLEEDDLFKHYASLMHRRGAKIVVQQHGGLYGQGRFVYNESNEISISDKFISWGWRKNDEKNDIALGLKSIRIHKRVSDEILVVLSGGSRFYNGHLSAPVGHYFVRYLEKQIELINLLQRSKRLRVRVRHYVEDNDWFVEERVRVGCEESVRFSERSIPFDMDVSSSKLVIHGWCSTSYLQTMSMNIPTLIYFDPEVFDFRESAQRDFNDLEPVGIYYRDPSSLVNFLNELPDISSWWNSSETQKMRETHLKMYCAADWSPFQLTKYLRTEYRKPSAE